MFTSIRKMKKCDIIIPIYNSPEWVKLCVYALFKNTSKDLINKVYLMDDNSDVLTKNCLINLEKKYDKVEIHTNENNLGFIKNVNKGLKIAKSDYVLLLNTDCLISKNVILNLINHVEKNPKIGLICPISSNAANLSFDIPEHYSYMQINDIFYEKFKGMDFDACTVVGNCLLMTRKCIDEVGFLDEAYGMGYGDETDYQFKAESKGFEAKVAIDAYVFHKSEVSFGTSPEKQARLEKNRNLFFERWGEQYFKKLEIYEKNDPIVYINNNLKLDEIIPEPEVLFYLPVIHQTAGGVHIVVDIINYLNINGFFANILTEVIYDNYKEIMLFSPTYLKNVKNVKPKCIVGTIYPSNFICQTISEYYNIPAVNFMQGYEMCFDNGEVYNYAELACRNSQNILAISNYLKDKCRINFNKDAYVISNGINLDLLYNNKERNVDRVTITMSFRNTFLKGDFILVEILKQITLFENNVDINVIYSNERMKFPINNNKSIKINKFKGPLDRKNVSDILKNTDIYIDTSLMEGFGLMSLEAMASGAVPVLSDSFGIGEYAEDGRNCFVIKEVNNADAYMIKIDELIKDKNKLYEMHRRAKETVKKFDIDDRVNQYIEYFKNVEVEKIHLTDVEQEEIQQYIVSKENIFLPDVEQEKIVNNENIFNEQSETVVENKISRKISRKRKIYKIILKCFPKKIKIKVKNIIIKMLQE